MPLRIAGRSDLATCPAREDQTSVSHFLPGWAKRGDGHQPSWGYGTKQEQHGDPAPHRRLDPTAFQSARRKRGPWYWCGMGVPPLPVASALAGPLERAARACRSQCTCVIDEKAPAESLTETPLSSNLIWKSLKVLSHALAQARTVQAKKQLFYI